MNFNIGIYQIRNLINGKSYIGSSMRIKYRWKQHEFRLKKGNHHSYKLQRAWDKYGEDNFEFKIIEVVDDVDLLIEKEQYWMDKYNVITNGYNVSPVAGICSNKGSDHPMSKLHEDDVLEIKEFIKIGKPFQEIANKFNITPENVSSIKSGNTWSHIGDNVSNVKYPPPGAKLTEDDVRKIKLLLKNGAKQREIAKMFNIDVTTVSNINTGKRWGYVDSGHDVDHDPVYNASTNRQKLSDDEIKEIKSLLKEGKIQRVIAEMYGVCRETIGKINTGKIYGHVS